MTKFYVPSIVCGDFARVFYSLSKRKPRLIFADPPFNIGYEYDVYEDTKERAQYLRWTEDWILKCDQMLAEDGSLWVAQCDENVAETKTLAEKVGLRLRSWVVWYYTFGMNCSKNFSRSHTHLLWFVKDPKKFVFNHQDPQVRVPSARQLVYKDRRGNPKGRLPDNTWILRPQEAEATGAFSGKEDTWHVPRVNGTFKERQGFHGCQMPTEVLRRIILACSNPGDLVFDPFTGSGTTLEAAYLLGRRSLGVELSESYCAAISKRIKSARSKRKQRA